MDAPAEPEHRRAPNPDVRPSEWDLVRAGPVELVGQLLDTRASAIPFVSYDARRPSAGALIARLMRLLPTVDGQIARRVCGPDRYRAAGPAGASIQIDALMLQLQRPRRRAMPSPAVGGDRTALASPGHTQKRRWVCVNGGFPERARKHGRLVRQRHDRFAADGHKQCSVWLRSQWPHLMAGLTHVSRLLSLKPQASSTSKAGHIGVGDPKPQYGVFGCDLADGHRADLGHGHSRIGAGAAMRRVVVPRIEPGRVRHDCAKWPSRERRRLGSNRCCLLGYDQTPVPPPTRPDRSMSSISRPYFVGSRSPASTTAAACRAVSRLPIRPTWPKRPRRDFCQDFGRGRSVPPDAVRSRR